MAKLFSFDKNFMFFLINMKITLSTKSFNKTFGLPYWPSYFIDIIFFLFVYIPTYLHIAYLLTHPPIYLLTFPPTHLPTYHLHDVNVYQCMIHKQTRYYTKWLTINLIIFDPLILINDNWMQVLHIRSSFVIDMSILHIFAVIVNS